MAESRSQDSFAKAFVPGLVLGLVVGAFAGVVLVDVFSGPRPPAVNELTPEQREALKNMPRDARPEEMTIEEPVEIPDGAHNDQHAEEDPDAPGGSDGEGG